MVKVTFDGPNKLIIVNPGIVELDVQVDIYSDWKEWAATGDNLKYPPALRTIGGDPVGTRTFGRGFYLGNGWKIRPHEAAHDLVLIGNLFLDDGESPGLIVPTLGGYTVLGIIERALEVFSVDVAAAPSLTAGQAAMLAELYKLAGLQIGDPMRVSTTRRWCDDISLDISESGGVVTVTRE